MLCHSSYDPLRKLHSFIFNTNKIMTVPKMTCPIKDIPQEKFEKLRLRERAYIVLIYEKNWNEKDIMERLLIDSRITFWRMKKKIKKWISSQYQNETQNK